MSVLAITKQINIMPQLLFGCMTLASRPGHDSETQLIMQYRSWCRERRSVAPAIHPSLCVWILLTLPSLPLPFPLSGLFLPFSSVFFFSYCLFGESFGGLFTRISFLYHLFLLLFCELLSSFTLFLHRSTKRQFSLKPKKILLTFYSSTYPFSWVNCSFPHLFAPFTAFYIPV